MHPFFEVRGPPGRRTYSAPATLRPRGPLGRQAVSSANPITPSMPGWNSDTAVATRDSCLRGKGYAHLHPRVPNQYQCYRSSDPDAYFPPTFAPRPQYRDDHVHDYVPAVTLGERVPRHCCVCGMKGQGSTQRVAILHACRTCSTVVCSMCVVRPQGDVARDVRRVRSRSQPVTRFVTSLVHEDGRPFVARLGRSPSPVASRSGRSARSPSPAESVRRPGTPTKSMFAIPTAFGLQNTTSHSTIDVSNYSISPGVPPRMHASPMSDTVDSAIGAPSPIPSLAASHSPYPARYRPGYIQSHSCARSGPASVASFTRLSSRASFSSYKTAASSPYGVNSSVRIPAEKRERDFLVKYWDAVA